MLLTRVKSYNLFDVNNYRVDTSGVLLFDISSLEIGKKYTITSSKPLSWFKISTAKSGYNSVQYQNTNNGFTKFTFTMAKNSNISEAKIQYLILGIKERVSESLPLGDVTDISQLDGYEIQIVEGTQVLPYEPF
jgi:hypothetical protein